MVAGTPDAFQTAMAKNIIGNKLNPGKSVIKGRPEDPPGFRERVYELVLRIPRGQVMSYGLVARALGAGYDARAIGNVMHATPDDGRGIPWHRVINSQGGCSTAGLTTPPDLQQRLLEAEGVVFNDKGRCEMAKYQWTPPEFEAESGREDDNQGSLFM